MGGGGGEGGVGAGKAFILLYFVVVVWRSVLFLTWFFCALLSNDVSACRGRLSSWCVFVCLAIRPTIISVVLLRLRRGKAQAKQWVSQIVVYQYSPWCRQKQGGAIYICRERANGSGRY